MTLHEANAALHEADATLHDGAEASAVANMALAGANTPKSEGFSSSKGADWQKETIWVPLVWPVGAERGCPHPQRLGQPRSVASDVSPDVEGWHLAARKRRADFTAS